ncbi:MAG: alkaline phosphatase family protein, partial [Candidatus Aenigmarchaeota archaeon]|nr:alkaline phosphatase family protein [Candidatus Aenigmarchaeota archaeon]
MTFLVLGIDAATWKVIKPNIDELPTFKKLLETCNSDTIHLKEKPYSPSIWCGMFSGKTPEEHGHREYVENGKIVTREDIKVDFIWDLLDREGIDIRAINVPFVVPPYNFNVDFEGVGFGLPTTPEEWEEELEKVTKKVIEILKEKPDVLIAVYTSLDRIQHFHWGEPLVLEWYKKMDDKLNEVLFKTGFMDDNKNKLIIISDHGFCSFGEAKVQTLPQKTSDGRILKGDHHEDAILITKNVDYEIKRPQDVFFALKKAFI